jgi:hypothetical protein
VLTLQGLARFVAFVVLDVSNADIAPLYSEQEGSSSTQTTGTTSDQGNL